MLGEPLQDLQQLCDVVKVQTRGRFVEHVQGSAGVAFGEFLRELDALRLAARKRRRTLTQTQVPEADFHQRIEFAGDRWDAGKKALGLFDRHLQHLGDIGTLPMHFECFAVIALSSTGIAGHVDVGQKVHFHPQHAVAFTRLAATVFDVE